MAIMRLRTLCPPLARIPHSRLRYNGCEKGQLRPKRGLASELLNFHERGPQQESQIQKCKDGSAVEEV